MYGDAVLRFFYEAVPTLPVPPEVKFEAISAAVFGSKQRRYGPMPVPEVQVGVRDILRDAIDKRGGVLDVFAPWGASKQGDGDPLDVLEFMAMKQLACMREELARFGVRLVFHFRLEDLTDRWLFSDGPVAKIEARRDQITKYVGDFKALAGWVLPDAQIRTEGDFVGWHEFRDTAERYTSMFYRVIRGAAGPETLEPIGWKGGIPQSQRDYYLQTYQHLYPGQDHEKILARYFAAAMARGKLGAVALPTDPFVFVTFAHPVPNDPVRKNRLYFRTLPERYTHQHFSPWLAKGYLRVTPDGQCSPRFVGADKVEDRLTPYTARFADATVSAPYLEE